MRALTLSPSYCGARWQDGIVVLSSLQGCGRMLQHQLELCSAEVFTTHGTQLVVLAD